MADVAFVLHGHFYQPPRENPWTEVVPREVSAAPFHDWNARITAESYRPNGWARILDEAGRILAIVDNYEHLSFNVGPTLLSWLEVHAPETYERILLADRRRGRAIAQAYGHAILPLCNDRDLRTQVRWGQADFRHRFGREPEGMWLPETAVDDRVLAVLAEEGVRFTILAPGQIAAVRPLPQHGHEPEWQAVDGTTALDTRRVHRWRHPERPDLGVDLVVYDGDISHDVAFGGFPSQVVLDRIVARSRGRSPGDWQGGLVAVACDGETFGHHHHFAERGVAYAMAIEAGRRHVATPGLAEWLDSHPPDWEARVHLSAWSCAHGVGRWMDDCGCHTGGEPGWNQRWRRPLRRALDLLRDTANEVFERRATAVLRDPWAARDAYIAVLLGGVTLDDFVVAHVEPGNEAAVVDALTLLECQRHALLMYTSCAWFFNDLAGIETLQILRYAARCLDLIDELGERPPTGPFLDLLAEAHSNRPGEGDGRAIWREHVEPARADPARVAGHIALVELLAGDGAITELGGYHVERQLQDIVDRGGLATSSGRVALTHRRTRRRTVWTYGAVHLGGLEVFGAVRPADDDLSVDAAAVAELADATRQGLRITALLRLVTDRFGPREFGLESVLPGVGDDLLHATAASLADRFVAAYDELRTDYHDTLVALAVAGTTLPAELRGPIELALARRLEAELAEAAPATDPGAYAGLRAIVREAREEGVQISSPRAAEALGRALVAAVEEAAADPGEATVGAAVGMVELARELGVPVDFGTAQERAYEAVTNDAAQSDPNIRTTLRPLTQILGLAL
jgi:alpha-amylase/alpha-mannosidase (GH57 family)